ncbi:pyridoxamine 5'-phosphate oxidase family protein [Desulfitobacterium sp. AusDCA]
MKYIFIKMKTDYNRFITGVILDVKYLETISLNEIVILKYFFLSKNPYGEFGNSYFKRIFKFLLGLRIVILSIDFVRKKERIMLKPLRRTDREMDMAGVNSLLSTGEYGVLSSTGENGFAYGIPLSYVFMDNSIYFHCATDGHKLENIRFNNKVSFCIVGETEPLPEKFSMKYQSVVIFGEAYEVFDEEKQKALINLVQKYANQFIEKGRQLIESDEYKKKTKVFRLKIEYISGKIRN